MIARATRTIAIGNTPVQIRDTTAKPVIFSKITVPSGGADIYVSSASNVSTTTGEKIPNGTVGYKVEDQSLLFYAIGSAAGPTNILVTDYEI